MVVVLGLVEQQRCLILIIIIWSFSFSGQNHYFYQLGTILNNEISFSVHEIFFPIFSEFSANPKKN
jgi:hypothetical protein